jgi:hypothetical protein
VRAYSQAGVFLADVPVSDGQVQFSLGGDGVRSGSLTVPGYHWAPSDPAAPLAPFGQYVTVEYDYGPLGVVSLGEFPILAVQVTRPGGAVQVTLGDWSFRIVRRVRESARTWKASTKALDLIDTLTEYGLRGGIVVEHSDIGASETIDGEGFTMNAGDSYWRAAADIADSFGCDIWFTERNRLQIRSRYATPQQPGERLDVGPGGVVVGMTSDVDVLTAYNAVKVIVESEDTEKTYTARRVLTTGPLAWDVDGVGEFTLVQTERLKSAKQKTADDLADRLFDRQVGVARKVALDVIPMPWIEVGDVVVIIGPSGSEDAVVESVSFPLTTATPSAITTRTEMKGTLGPYQGTTPTFLGADS